MLQKRFWLPALIIMAFLLGIFIFWLTLQQAATSQKPGMNSVKNAQNSLNEFEGTTISVPGTEKDCYWELKVNSIEVHDDVDNLEHLDGVYFVKKKPYYRISSKSGVVYLKTKVIKVIGNVDIKTIDNSKELTADEVVWDPTLKNVTARQNVTMKTRQTTITTNEVISNLSFDQITFTGLTKIVYQGLNHD